MKNFLRWNLKFFTHSFYIFIIGVFNQHESIARTTGAKSSVYLSEEFFRSKQDIL